MRVMLKISIPTEDGNKAIRDGSLGKTIETAMAELKPEAAYFTVDGGKRTAFMVLDMKDSSQMPVIGERFFFALNASIEVVPVMNADDLKKGLPVAMAALAAA